MSYSPIIATGTYAGTGAAGIVQTIGWQPALVIIASSRTQGLSTLRGLGIKHAANISDNAVICSNAAYNIGGSVTLTSTGFEVGNTAAINSSGYTFYWIAVREGSDIDNGFYVGDGTSSQSVDLGRQPSMVILYDVNLIDIHWKMTSMAGNTDFAYKAAVVENTSDTIQLTSTGFTGYTPLNTNTMNYNWIALYDLPGTTRNFIQGTYTGNGTSLAVDVGDQPKFVFTMGSGGTTQAAFKQIDMPSSNYGNLAGAYNWLSDSDIVITSTGFTVGSSSLNLNTVEYHYIVGIN